MSASAGESSPLLGNHAPPSGSSRTQHDAKRENFEQFQKAVLEALSLPITNLLNWSRVALTLVSVSVGMLIVGVLLVYLQQTTTALVSTSASILSSAISLLLNSQLRAARKEVAANRPILLNEFRSAAARMFDERDPKVISYINNEGAAGQFVKIDELNWNDVSMREDKSYIYRLIFSRFEGTRLYLKDNLRNIEIEIDYDNKQIWWIEGSKRSYLYRIVGIS